MTFEDYLPFSFSGLVGQRSSFSIEVVLNYHSGDVRHLLSEAPRHTPSWYVLW